MNKFDKIYKKIINENIEVEDIDTEYNNDINSGVYKLTGTYRVIKNDYVNGPDESVVIAEGEYDYTDDTLLGVLQLLKNEEDIDFSNAEITNKNNRTEIYGNFSVDENLQDMKSDDEKMQQWVNGEIEGYLYDYTIFVEKLQYTKLTKTEEEKLVGILKNIK